MMASGHETTDSNTGRLHILSDVTCSTSATGVACSDADRDDLGLAFRRINDPLGSPLDGPWCTIHSNHTAAHGKTLAHIVLGEGRRCIPRITWLS